MPILTCGQVEGGDDGVSCCIGRRPFQRKSELKRDRLLTLKLNSFFAKKVYILYHKSMKFEFDQNKSTSNKEKHGLDFEEAMLLWEDPDLLEIPAKTVQDENRYLVIGKIEKNTGRL